MDMEISVGFRIRGNGLVYVTVHAVALGILCSALIYDQWILEEDLSAHRGTYGGRTRFLTIWNMYVDIAYYVVCLLNDAVGTNESEAAKRSLLQKTRDFLFSVLAFPLGMFVVVTFWTVYVIKHDYVIPLLMDSGYSSWLNHVTHTAPLPVIITDLILCRHTYLPRWQGLLCLFGFELLYASWFFHVSYITNDWVYAFLQPMVWWERICAFIACAGMILSYYVLGDVLTKRLWDMELEKLREITISFMSNSKMKVA